jgi:hypothetical protein
MCVRVRRATKVLTHLAHLFARKRPGNTKTRRVTGLTALKVDKLILPISDVLGTEKLGRLGTVDWGIIREHDRITQVLEVGSQGRHVAGIEGRHVDDELAQGGRIGHGSDRLIDELLVRRRHERIVIGRRSCVVGRGQRRDGKWSAHVPKIGSTAPPFGTLSV